MDFNQIKELISIVNASEFRNFELSNEGTAIKMSKNTTESSAPIAPVVPQQPVVVHKDAVTEKQATPVETKEEAPVSGNVVKAPLVGTFYASASPDKPPFVSKGATVKKGDVLCIIEAMKVMNEVVSEFDGEVVEISVENEAVVEFGQKLFTIR